MLRVCSSARPAPVQDAPLAPAHCRMPVRLLGVARRSCAPAGRSFSVIKAAKPEAAFDRKSSAERLGLGRWDEERVSYKERAIIRSYEVGVNKTATVQTMANLLQEVACNHVQCAGYSKDGFGTTTAMRRLRVIWVTNRMHIELLKYPARGDAIEVETWCDLEGRIGTRRDWVIRDLATSEVIGRCTSMWAMMNQDTRKLERVVDEVREECLPFCPNRYAIPKEEIGSYKKIPKLVEPGEYSRLGLVPRRADLDMNQHVNNVTYIGWILDSVPQHVIDTHELQTITLEYRRECQHDNMVDSLTSLEPAEHESTNGSSVAMQHAEENYQFVHLLRLSGSGLEINRARTVWRRKSVR